MFAAAYNALALQAALNGQRLWKVQPQNHMMCHLIYDMAPVANPRWVHNYMDESFIGLIKRVAAACHPDAIHVRVVDRFLIWCCLVLYKRGIEILPLD